MQEPPHTMRDCVPALEKILLSNFPVLDQGFVRVIDYMGSDRAIVQAARVSYGKGTKSLANDRGLIRYLMRHRHTTPFEMCEIKLHVRVPMDCWRQWIRHRTANVNEYSTRYSIAIDVAQRTAPDSWRMQSSANKQGSAGHLNSSLGSQLTRQETEIIEKCGDVYRQRLELGVAREQARKDLPLSTYTEAYWKIDLHNLMHFLSLRMDGHAQHEIRSYAKVIGEKIVSLWCPLTWEAFEDYRLKCMTLTAREIALLKALSLNGNQAALRLAVEWGWIGKEMNLRQNRERSEADAKLSELAIEPPWNSLPKVNDK